MKDGDLLIVGLGNPGEQYQNNRHNIGFFILDEMASRWKNSLSKEKWNSLYGALSLCSRKTHLLKPMTYMNVSGKAVLQCYNFFKVNPLHLLVIHDDLDLPPGRVKLVRGGGAGGHNGIKSIASSLGTNDFFRLKIGIGRPGQGDVHKDFPVEKYVLGDLGESEMEILADRFDDLEKGVAFFVKGEPEKAMNLLNGLR